MPNSKLFLASVEAAEKASWEDRMANILPAAADCRVGCKGWACEGKRRQWPRRRRPQQQSAGITWPHAMPSHLFLARRGTPEASRKAKSNTGCRALLAGPPAGVTDWHSGRRQQ